MVTGGEYDPDEDDYFSTGNVRDGNFERREVAVGDNSGDQDLQELELEDLMKEGRKLLLVDLVRLVRSGQASPQEKNTLRQMLKDNGMIAGDPLGDDEPDTERARKRRADLPSYEDPEYR